MNNSPLIQQAFRDDWHNLPVAIQNHYQIQQGKQTQNIVTGTMHINYPAFVKPILIIVRMMGGLIDLKGENMSARVEKWLRRDAPGSLFCKRSIQAPNGKHTVFASRMDTSKAMN
jgi:hypothetical protein